MRVEVTRRVFGLVESVLYLALLTMAGGARAETPPPVTVIVFAARDLHEGTWTALFAALRRNLQPVDGPVEVLRGEAVRPGMAVETPVAVYLHGDCTLLPRQRFMVTGALGWVVRTRGRIAPFVHVDCDKLAQMLGSQALRLTSEQRDVAMANAMARVIEHEWIHIRTQSAAHSTDGVEKALFGVQDLLAEDAELRRGMGRGR